LFKPDSANNTEQYEACIEMDLGQGTPSHANPPRRLRSLGIRAWTLKLCIGSITGTQSYFSAQRPAMSIHAEGNGEQTIDNGAVAVRRL